MPLRRVADDSGPVLGLLRTIALAVVASALAGCASTMSGAPIPAEPDVRHLDVGHFPVEPIDANQEYRHFYKHGKDIATIRLVNHVALGTDIDPNLVFGYGTNELSDSSSWSLTTSDAGAAAALRNKAMFGFLSSSTDKDTSNSIRRPPGTTMVTVSVIQFPTDEDATHAAADIEHAEFDTEPGRNRAIQLPRNQAAHAHLRPSTAALSATITAGHYVVGAFVEVPAGDPTALTTLADKVFDAQIPMLSALPPLSPLEVLKLDPDPDRMLRRVLNPIKLWMPSTTMLASYDLHGFLHFQRDRVAAKRLYGTLPIDRFAVSEAYAGFLNGYGEPYAGSGTDYETKAGALLFRASDDATAEKIASKLLATKDTSSAPPNVPGAECTQQPGMADSKKFTCVVHYRRYIGRVWGTQSTDAQQRAAAQYALLANSQWM